MFTLTAGSKERSSRNGRGREQALDALESGAAAAGLAERPAVVATCAALRERLGDAAGARRLVQATLDALRGGGARPRAPGGAAAEGVPWLLERLARLQLHVRPSCPGPSTAWAVAAWQPGTLQGAGRAVPALRDCSSGAVPSCEEWRENVRMQAGEVDAAFGSYRELRAAAPDAPATAALLGALAKAAVAADAAAAGALAAELPPVPPLPAAQVDALEAAAFGAASSCVPGG